MLFVAYYLMVKVQPYELDHFNATEGMSLAAALAIFYFIMLIQSMSKYPGLQTVWIVIIALIFFAFIFYFIKQAFITAIIDFKAKVSKSNYEQQIDMLLAKFKEGTKTHRLLKKIRDIIVKNKPPTVAPGVLQVREMFQSTKDKIDYTDKNYQKEDEFLSYKRHRVEENTKIIFATTDKDSTVLQKRLKMYGKSKHSDSDDEELNEAEKDPSKPDDGTAKIRKKNKKRKAKKAKKPRKLKKKTKVANLLDSESGSSDEEPIRAVAKLSKFDLPPQDISHNTVAVIQNTIVSPKIMVGGDSPSGNSPGMISMSQGDASPFIPSPTKKSLFSFTAGVGAGEDNANDRMKPQVKKIELVKLDTEENEEN